MKTQLTLGSFLFFLFATELSCSSFDDIFGFFLMIFSLEFSHGDDLWLFNIEVINKNIANFFERASRRALRELDSSTLTMLQEMAAAGKFTAIGQVYKKYAERFNDQLEPVCIYKKL